MLHIDGRAVALGAVIGVTAGAGAARTVRLELAKRTNPHPDQMASLAWILPIFGCIAGVLVGARFEWSWPLPAYLCLVAVAPMLCGLDLVARALPNRFVLPLYPASTAMLALAAWRSRDGFASFWMALMAGAVVFAVFLAVALVAPPGSLGWGDVKLVGALGLLLGYLGWLTVWLGLALAFGLACMYIVIRAASRHQRGEVIPLGPALVIGALAAAIAH